MSSLTKILLLVGVIIAIGVGLVVWKNKIGGHHEENLNSISRQEMELLLKDANPMMLKRLAEDPELKKKQAENLRQLLALASQAQKDGLDKDEAVKQELKNIEAELIAVNYDREINKDKGSMPPFGFITEEQVKQFWEGGHEAEFKKFIDTKINLMKASNPEMKDREISEEEMEQAKEFYAKIKIYEKEYKDKLKAGEINKELQEKIALQVKLQKAQFLARQYATKLGDKAEVTEEDIDKYLAAHPELDPKDKRAKAEELLNRAKSGEDFAKLANEFSTDPGNKNAQGESQGGLYKDVQQGRMMKEFEAAALALEPGQIAPNLVETPYGYHIVKLEKKGESKEQGAEQPGITYDVRHILISTGVKDPENPMSREMPVREFVRSKLQEEKEKQILDEILANNKVEVAEDYTVPEVSQEQMQQMQQKMMQQQMQQMQQGEEGEMEPPPPAPNGKAPSKPAAKK